MKTDDETTLKGKIKNKTDIKNKVDMLEDIEGEWEVDPKTNQMRVNFGGQMKEDGMGKGGLTAADKAWIAGLIRPIQEDISSLKKDVKTLKEDMVQVKKDIKAIKECPTIKKELKKDDKYFEN